jgi:predicted amidohydrolase
MTPPGARFVGVDELRAAPPAPLTVAAGQATCAPGDVPANATVAADLVRRAADRGAALLVLPELFLDGYDLADADGRGHVVAADDPRLEPVAAACADTGTAVVVGAATRDAAGPHISALVVGRDGRPAGRYDKQHLDPAERAAGFRPGAGGCSVVVDGWRLGLAVCWDIRFPEHARAAARDGCHAYLVGALFDRGRGDHRRATVGPARALDNAFYVVLANHVGRAGPYDGCGNSAAWDPDGRQLADAGTADPGLAVARLDPAALYLARAGDLPLVDPSLARPALAHPTPADRAGPRREVVL